MNLDLHPITPDIRTQILQKLTDIEQEHNIRILFACESGSRGWGFASPDSDYDVRFIYAHPLPWYLQVTPQRDVIEYPVNAVFDVNGWELRKALGLLKKGNATLIEWLDSPVVYRADGLFMQQMRQAIQTTFQPERSFHHYIHMARGNYREYLRGSSVRLKKYLYVLRPLLAVLWVERGKGVPPMPFQQLVDGLITDPELLTAIDDLLRRKRQAGEAEYGQPLPAINHFIETELERLSTTLPPSNDAVLDFTVLDDVLHHAIVSASPLEAKLENC